MTDCYNRRLSINGPIMHAKPLKLEEEFNRAGGDSLRTKFTFSEESFAAFKLRCDIRIYRLHGESDDCDDVSMQPKLPDINSKLRAYSAKNTFNADELGLLYNMAPTTIVAAATFVGRKKRKNAFPYLLAPMRKALKIEIS